MANSYICGWQFFLAPLGILLSCRGLWIHSSRQACMVIYSEISCGLVLHFFGNCTTPFLIFLPHPSLSDVVAKLREATHLPCAKGTRQKPLNTRQILCRVLHTANSTRHTLAGKEAVCRVSFLGHTAKYLPCAPLGTRQIFFRRNKIKLARR